MKRLLGLYRALLVAGICVVLLGVSPPAFADEPPAPRIYVVEVLGGPLVAEHLRGAVARELSVTAVAPDDPRAATASARLQFDARGGEKSLRVTFQRAEVPVTRVVTLPDDAARAETVAVFLAGNLARDEASDLLQGLGKPSAGKPAEADAEAQAQALAQKRRDADDLERMRRMLHDEAERGRRVRVGGAIGQYAAGAALIVPGIIIRQEDSNAARDAGFWLMFSGAALTLDGTLDLFSRSREEAVYAELTTVDRAGQDPAIVVQHMERAWKTEADNARAFRRFGGGLYVAMGATTLTVGTVTALHRPIDAISVAFVALGAVEALVGVYKLFATSSVERSWAAWQVLRQEPAAAGASAAVRPTFGLAPTRGGAYFSAGFTF